MLDILLEAFAELPSHLTTSMPRRRFSGPPPSPAALERADGLLLIYKAWAERRGFVPTEHGYAGNVVGHAVTVRPGLDGSQPRGVEAEIALAHDIAPVLLKPDARAKAEDIAVLFDEIPTLQTIGIYTGGVRLRLAALVHPDDVDAAMDRAISLFEERIRTQARPDPYR